MVGTGGTGGTGWPALGGKPSALATSLLTTLTLLPSLLFGLSDRQAFDRASTDILLAEAIVEQLSQLFPPCVWAVSQPTAHRRWLCD